ncbi:hypothetical protein B0H13DRAFT_1885224 [Mycena leptocephala]|nr:hypothetical protein B0H13DRAFT_1885224 [Mycena leptocephala]
MPGALPFTTSTHPHAQQKRLMWSARTLEALLGETPFFAGAIGPSSNAARHNLRPVLIVRLPSVPRSIPSTTHSSLSPTSAINFNSPVSTAVAEEEGIARVLYEHIRPACHTPSRRSSCAKGDPNLAAGLRRRLVCGSETCLIPRDQPAQGDSEGFLAGITFVENNSVRLAVHRERDMSLFSRSNWPPIFTVWIFGAPSSPKDNHKLRSASNILALEKAEIKNPRSKELTGQNVNASNHLGSGAVDILSANLQGHASRDKVSPRVGQGSPEQVLGVF